MAFSTHLKRMYYLYTLENARDRLKCVYAVYKFHGVYIHQAYSFAFRRTLNLCNQRASSNCLAFLLRAPNSYGLSQFTLYVWCTLVLTPLFDASIKLFSHSFTKHITGKYILYKTDQTTDDLEFYTSTYKTFIRTK